MNIITHDEVLDKYIGEKGTEARDKFDAEVEGAVKVSKKRLQQERSWFKYQLTGMIRPINPLVLTLIEWQIYQQIQIAVKELITIHDDSSRKLGLNVPVNRCWCRKEGKISYAGEWYCNKHYKQRLYGK